MPVPRNASSRMCDIAELLTISVDKFVRNLPCGTQAIDSYKEIWKLKNEAILR